MTKQQKRNEKKRGGHSHYCRKMLRAFLRCFGLPLGQHVIEIVKTAKLRKPLTQEQKEAKNKAAKAKRLAKQNQPSL